MKKKISLLQMDIALGEPETNFAHAVSLMERAMADAPDIFVLPETMNTGFVPENLSELADENGAQTKEIFGHFAEEHSVNIIAGSAAVRESGVIYNRAHVFDRAGALVAAYDKIHGFTPMGEEKLFKGGDHTVRFTLDGIPCSLAICYDLRFPELIRTETVKGVDLFFLPAAWPLIRREHWVTLSKARAIENQMYFCAVNGCGKAGETQYGGNSLLISPWGEEICHLGEAEEVRTGTIDLDIIAGIRESINVFRDRKPWLYHVN